MRLFYDPHIQPDTAQHQLSEEESKHIVRVLRMKAGEKLGILDGKGGYYIGTLMNENPKKCEVQIEQHFIEETPEYSIHIAISPTKQMERMEWLVEKATEIGVTEMTFLHCSNSERTALKLDRLEKKAISAMKQSHRKFLPKLSPLISFNEFIRKHPNGLLAHCYDDQKYTLDQSFRAVDCPILIGPEGDFTLSEIEAAKSAGYTFITLGENRLRTETAALYACMHANLLVS